MAFERPSKTMLTFVCDCCGETFEIFRRDGTLHNFKECWEEAREEGWRIRDGEHHCGDCAGLE